MFFFNTFFIFFFIFAVIIYKFMGFLSTIRTKFCVDKKLLKIYIHTYVCIYICIKKKKFNNLFDICS